MGIFTPVLLYLIGLAAFVAVDMLWLGIIAKKFYAKQLGHLLRPQVNWPPAIVFYLLFIAGIIIFAVQPGLSTGSWGKTALLGALFGLFCYSTYDLSNWATLKDWPRIVVAVDIIWGMSISTIVALIVFAFGRLF